jgi:hypothetical protein
VLYKIYVKTPNNQATNAMLSLRKKLLTMELEKNIVEENLINHHFFSWTLRIDEPKQEQKLIENITKTELIIKIFYKELIKRIDRSTVLKAKFKKDISWCKRWIVTQTRKKTKGKEADSTIEYINNMDILTYDKKEWDKLLNEKMIWLEKIEG